MFQTKVVEKIKTRVLFSATFFFFENRAVYEITWKNPAEEGRPQMTIWHMRTACRITKATHTLTISNIYCFTTVALRRLNVTFICTWPVLYNRPALA
jgi:hypothetical protein